jgi:nitrogen fixation NifU-like protein
LNMSGSELSAPLGPLPPMKIHCAQLVEGALKNALAPTSATTPAPTPAASVAPTLMDSFGPKSGSAEKKVNIVIKPPGT